MHDRRRRPYRVPLVAFACGALFISGVASAQWLAEGNGKGHAKARTPQPLTTVAVAESAAADLYPGASGDLTLRIVNPNPYAVTVSSVVGDGLITSSSSACDAAGHGVTFSDRTGLALAIPAGGEATHVVSQSVHMATDSAAACAGAQFEIPVALSGYAGARSGGSGGAGTGPDSDGDGVPDSEDCAPDYVDENPDDGRCHALATIYDLRNAPPAAGSIVDVLGVVVTAVAPSASAAWIQVPPDHPVYAGAEFSGLRLDDIAGSASATDRVDVRAQWDGERLIAASVTVVGTGPAIAPTTIDETAADWSLAYDGVLVTLIDEVVASQSGDGGFETTTGVRVDPLVAGTLPDYPSGATLTSVTGVFDRSPTQPPLGTLHPRSSADIVVAS